MALTRKQEIFVAEYLVDFNATRAAKAAGYSAKTAEKIGSENLRKPEIEKAIAAAKEARLDRVHATQDDVLEVISAWVKADPRELIEHRRVCCRFCYSPNGQPQERPSERHERKKKHDERLHKTPMDKWHLLPAWDELGGVGYDHRKPPVPDCAECWGDGEEMILIKDTRTLSKGAAMLYGGVKKVMGGIEVKMQPKDKAVEMLARHYGLDKSGDGEDASAPRTIVHKSDPDA